MGDFRVDWYISGVNLVWKSDFHSFSVEFKGLAISVYQNFDTAAIFEYQKSYGLWTLAHVKFQGICIGADHVSENDILVLIIKG